MLFTFRKTGREYKCFIDKKMLEKNISIKKNYISGLFLKLIIFQHDYSPNYFIMVLQRGPLKGGGGYV